jgi:hypothetical protein
MTMAIEAGPSGPQNKLIGALIILAIVVVIAGLLYGCSILAGDPWKL